MCFLLNQCLCSTGHALIQNIESQQVLRINEIADFIGVVA